ncbi:FtsW/RodA/SpoVE family cell cycle protein [Candidatus Saccharibacteria bacterium TM7i]|nr:FtsW/RodA/SpoVE family cell cycle protein [Candidatus Saccharibacteria bacterium TM7i]
MERGGWTRRGRSAPEGVVRVHKPDRLILVMTFVLMLVGLLVIYAIGPQRANLMNSLGYDYSDQYFFVKQAVSFALALIAFFAAYKIPHSFILKHGSKVLWAGFIACIGLAIAAKVGIVEETLGAARWISLGPLGSIQPSEILKFGLLTYLAVFLGVRMKEGAINDLHKTLIPIAVIVGLALFMIVVVQRDLGTGISLTAIAASMLFVGGLDKKYLAILGVTMLVLGLILIFTSPHRVERVMTFLQGDNTSVSDADSYHIEHAKIAIGSGGIFGVGIGDSVQASGYLPEAINDSIFAIIGETFGFVGTMALIALFVTLLMRLLQTMDHLLDPKLRLLVAGVFGWMAAHVILNIAAMIGIFPLTGITLPLLSYGGTSMIFITAALGLAYQLSRYTVHTSQVKEATGNEDSRSRRGVGRTRHASRRGA